MVWLGVLRLVEGMTRVEGSRWVTGFEGDYGWERIMGPGGDRVPVWGHLVALGGSVGSGLLCWRSDLRGAFRGLPRS